MWPFKPNVTNLYLKKNIKGLIKAVLNNVHRDWVINRLGDLKAKEAIPMLWNY